MLRSNRSIRADALTIIDTLLSGEEGGDAPTFPKVWAEAEEKLTACFHALQKLHAEALEGKQHIEVAKAFVATRNNAIDRVEAEIKMTMEFLGMNKLDRPDAKITYVSGRDKLDLDPDFSIDMVPADFVRVVPEKRELDKVAALAAVKAGTPIPGLRVGTGEPSLCYNKPKE